MTLGRDYYVVCDIQNGCRYAGPSTSGSAKLARTLARQEGWKRIRNPETYAELCQRKGEGSWHPVWLDVCPRCAAQYNAEVEERKRGRATTE